MLLLYEDFRSVYEIPNTIIWYMKTKDFDEFPFCYGEKGDGNPLENISDFDNGNFWIVDCKNTIGDFYPTFPEDDSFALIPKNDVIKVWSEDVNLRRTTQKYNL